MALPSKTKIDKAGLAIAKGKFRDEVDYIELEETFDEYRKAHLQPLSETTLELQQLLANYGSPYYIAQRLKRKPQIVRKLNRLSVRLTQLQDIGGCRIIVHHNSDVDKCQVSQETVPLRSWPLFRARDVLNELRHSHSDTKATPCS